MERQKVLIPLDGSDFSRQVVPFVRDLCDPSRHTLTLLRVASVPEGVTTPPPRPLALDGWLMGEPRAVEEHPIFQSQVWEAVRADVEASLMPVAETLGGAGFDVRILVRFGVPEDEIVDLVEREGVAMVVLATHGRSGVSRLLMGSVAGSVLRRVHVPIMMVRPRAASEVDEEAPSA